VQKATNRIGMGTGPKKSKNTPGDPNRDKITFTTRPNLLNRGGVDDMLSWEHENLLNIEVFERMCEKEAHKESYLQALASEKITKYARAKNIEAHKPQKVEPTPEGKTETEWVNFIKIIMVLLFLNWLGVVTPNVALFLIQIAKRLSNGNLWSGSNILDPPFCEKIIPTKCETLTSFRIVNETTQRQVEQGVGPRNILKKDVSFKSCKENG